MIVAYIDCIAGVSGDMLLGALLDAGVVEAELRARLADLRLPGFSLAVRRVQKVGIGALTVDVQVTDHATERHVPAIIDLVENSAVADSIKRRAAAIFRRLGEVEAAIHGTTPERVHLHELGGIDTIVDVVGVLIGFELLGVERVVCSPLPLARGFVDAAHGRLPLPAPATVALLQGVPVTGAEVTGELVTPTGAALVTALAAEFGPVPAMELQATGYGARQPRTAPFRTWCGCWWAGAAAPAAREDSGIPAQRLFMIETNIDDMNPEWYDYVSAALFAGGAPRGVHAAGGDEEEPARHPAERAVPARRPRRVAPHAVPRNHHHRRARVPGAALRPASGGCHRGDRPWDDPRQDGARRRHRAPLDTGVRRLSARRRGYRSRLAGGLPMCPGSGPQSACEASGPR